MSAYTAFPGRFEPVAGTDRYEASEDLAWDISRVGSGYPITLGQGGPRQLEPPSREPRDL